MPKEEEIYIKVKVHRRSKDGVIVKTKAGFLIHLDHWELEGSFPVEDKEKKENDNIGKQEN